MQLRRALLLFAIVLLLGSVVASIAPPPDTRKRGDAAPPAQASPPPGRSRGESVNVNFNASGEPRTATARRGQHVVVTVAAAEAGEVRFADLGLTAAVTATTPARFDLLPERAGRFRALFTPAGSDRARTAGILAIGA